jgi:hypothetical protein
MPKTPKNGTTRVANSKPNKSAFVRSLPPHTPGKDVVEAAKANGMRISVAYVYSIRASVKNAARRAGAVVPGATKRRDVHADQSANHAEDLLRAVAAELGLSVAIRILEGEQEKVRAVLAT